MNLSSRTLALFLITTFTLLIAACGGGGSGPGVAATTAAAPPATGMGKIVILVGDDDISNWDQAIFEITRVILLGGSNGQVVILDEMRTIDFLALETVNEILAAVVLMIY